MAESDALGHQLAAVIAAGLEARPDLRPALAESLIQDKGTKAEANYREATDDSERCGTCRHYDDTGSCDLVSGPIDPSRVCDWWDGAGQPSRDSADDPGGSPDSGDHGDGADQP